MLRTTACGPSDRAADPMAPKPAFLLHLPKTGGTSLRKMLERVVGRRHVLQVYDWESEQQALTADRATLERYRLVVGHYRVAVWLPFTDMPLITLLRDPVDRVASHYRYARSWDHDRFHEEALRQPLVEFALADLGRSLNNCQTYNLSTSDAPMGAAEMRARPPYGGLRGTDADEAIGYLARPNVLPGLHEAFAETVALACVWLGLEPPALEQVNRSPDRAGDRLQEVEQAAIANKNALDVRIYDAARDLFWDKWRAAGDEAKHALERVRRRPSWGPRLRTWQEERLRGARQRVRRLRTGSRRGAP